MRYEAFCFLAGWIGVGFLPIPEKYSLTATYVIRIVLSLIPEDGIRTVFEPFPLEHRKTASCIDRKI